jgi:hypothetical protein
MLPDQLTADSFAAYPPEAKKTATLHLALLKRLPLSYLSLLLRELIVYDFKFPAERTDLTRQFTYLEALEAAPFRTAMSATQANSRAGADRLGQLPWTILRTALRASLGHSSNRYFPQRRCRLYE